MKNEKKCKHDDRSNDIFNNKGDEQDKDKDDSKI